MKTIELLGGAFTAELIKGKWKYTHHEMAPKKEPEKKENLKETPQYKLQTEYESFSVKRFQGTLRSTVLDITKLLKTVSENEPIH
jgi:hypothetical protein